MTEDRLSNLQVRETLHWPWDLKQSYRQVTPGPGFSVSTIGTSLR